VKVSKDNRGHKNRDIQKVGWCLVAQNLKMDEENKINNQPSGWVAQRIFSKSGFPSESQASVVLKAHNLSR
jgi:hypothetical protein